MIASKNYVSQAVLAAQGLALTNKYTKSLPGRRFYGGCQDVDEVQICRAFPIPSTTALGRTEPVG
ncbi:MAG: hypothetical protein JRJ59_13185 [Deltaproteobacteria bacterium]|nr:hypothetical protein [Deltaproteobacteria bacterium]